MTCGIYKITEEETGRCYIGQSKNIEGRWNRHHKRFSPDSFSYEIIMECDAEQLDFWEIAWITSERSVEFGFNQKLGGQGWLMNFSPEVKKKLSEAAKRADHSRNSGAGKAARAGAKSQLASGNHNFQKKVTCPHCNLTGSGAIYRWHFDNCKVKQNAR